MGWPAGQQSAACGHEQVESSAARLAAPAQMPPNWACSMHSQSDAAASGPAGAERIEAKSLAGGRLPRQHAGSLLGRLPPATPHSPAVCSPAGELPCVIWFVGTAGRPAEISQRGRRADAPTRLTAACSMFLRPCSRQLCAEHRPAVLASPLTLCDRSLKVSAG